MDYSQYWREFVSFGQNLTAEITFKLTGIELSYAAGVDVFYASIALVVVGFLLLTRQRNISI